jgi:hypothetical protein
MVKYSQLLTLQDLITLIHTRALFKNGELSQCALATIIRERSIKIAGCYALVVNIILRPYIDNLEVTS